MKMNIGCVAVLFGMMGIVTGAPARADNANLVDKRVMPPIVTIVTITAIEKIERDMVAILGQSYEIGKYEITQEIWQEIVGSEPWQRARGITNPSQFKSCGVNCPAENISWDDTQEFINMLNHKTGRQYRLPTEAEWEYACYGGSKDEYCGSNNIDAVAWYEKNSNGQTHPVGQKLPNGYGLYDMSGNVEEWIGGACYSQYETEEQGCSFRTLRGGSWVSHKESLRVISRSWNGEAFRYPQFGFRLARTIPSN